MPKKKITLTETEVTPAEAELLACWLAAKRANKQAEAILKKLGRRVLLLAKKHPDLLFDGARITGGKQVVWSYEGILTVALAAQDLDVKQKQARARYFERDETSTATPRTVEFPQMRELKDFAKQVPEKEASRGFLQLFTSRG